MFIHELADSYSQHGQDKSVINFYKGKVGGYYLDIGANDGINLSNTLVLEKRYSWKGICFEPLKDVFPILKKIRSAICIEKAAFSRSGEIVEFLPSTLWSGITNYIEKDSYAETNRQGESYSVETVRVNEVLQEYSAPKFIEYMSLDTEGSEYDILQGIDLDKYIFGYICVEHNFKDVARSNIRNLLLSKGYMFIRENNCDDDYIHKSMIEGTYYWNNQFDKPITVTVENGTNQVIAKSDYWSTKYGFFNGYNMEIIFSESMKKKVYAGRIEGDSEDDAWIKIN